MESRRLKKSGCEKCGGAHLARGLCQRHYNEARRSGQFTDKRYMFGASVGERLGAMSRVDPVSGCRIWVGNISRTGYGRLSIGNRLFLAHRVAYAHWNGPVPDGALVCHHCDTPACIEPEHLFLGTDADNMADKVRKGRQYKGEGSPNAVLTEAQVIAIRDSDDRPHRVIANEYGITQQEVSSIQTGKIWAHLEPSPVVAERLRQRAARAERGQSHPNCKITPEDVRAIRADQRVAGEIAAAFGISRTLVGNIKTRKAWRHVE